MDRIWIGWPEVLCFQAWAVVVMSNGTQESTLHSKASRHASSSTAAPAMEALYRSPN